VRSRLPKTFLSALLLWSLAVGGVQVLLEGHGTTGPCEVETRVQSLPVLAASDMRSTGLPVLEEDAEDDLDADGDVQFPVQGDAAAVLGRAPTAGATVVPLSPQALAWRARVLGAQGPPARAA